VGSKAHLRVTVDTATLRAQGTTPAPFITNEDIGAAPDLGDPASLLNPFIGKQGNAEQSYMIQLIGEAEKAKILADEKPLLDELCAYRDVLCLAHAKH
jgi:hypothetical protein